MRMDRDSVTGGDDTVAEQGVSALAPAFACDRRSFVRGGVALGALALVAPLAGCSVLGIEDPAEDEAATQTEETPGTLDFRGLQIALTLDQATWSWSKISNAGSAINGSIVVGIPVTVTNNDEQRRVVNSMYCKVAAPDGTQLTDLSPYYTTDDLLSLGSISSGSSATRVLHVPYSGAGTYTLECDNMLGNKASLPFEVGSAAATGLHPIPDDALGATDAQNAVPYGTPFNVCGLSLTFTSDEDSYWWVQAVDETNEVWNGRWCVGVPVTVSNPTSAPVAITPDLYGLFAPALYKVEDPAPWFQDSSLGYLGAIAAGATVQTMMFWPWIEDGNYYAVFDSDGAKVTACVHFVNV